MAEVYLSGNLTLCIYYVNVNRQSAEEIYLKRRYNNNNRSVSVSNVKQKSILNTNM